MVPCMLFQLVVLILGLIQVKFQLQVCASLTPNNEEFSNNHTWVEELSNKRYADHHVLGSIPDSKYDQDFTTNRSKHYNAEKDGYKDTEVDERNFEVLSPMAEKQRQESQSDFLLLVLAAFGLFIIFAFCLLFGLFIWICCQEIVRDLNSNTHNINQRGVRHQIREFSDNLATNSNDQGAELLRSPSTGGAMASSPSPNSPRAYRIQTPWALPSFSDRPAPQPQVRRNLTPPLRPLQNPNASADVPPPPQYGECAHIPTTILDMHATAPPEEHEEDVPPYFNK